MIDLEFMFLADAANLSQEGKLNILGEFNIVHNPAYPGATTPFVMVIRLSAHATDEGEHTVGLRLLNDDGRLIWSTSDGVLHVPSPPNPALPTRIAIITPTIQVSLPAAGTYEFELFIDGQPARCRDQRAPGAELHALVKV